MEKLKIVNVRGEVVLEQDLTGKDGPILLVEKADKVELAQDVSADDRVLGALIRTVDGWDIASSDPAEPVRSGPKAQGSMPMLSGTSLSLGKFVFALETEKAEARDMLIWRVGKSDFAADALLPGRNVLAVDQVTNRLLLNPMLPKEVSFMFFLTSDGIETVANDGSHLAVPRQIRFSCGEFEGMVLAAAEATQAIKERNPFAYPSRGIWQKLLFWTVGAFAFLAIAGKLHKEALSVERQTASRNGAEWVCEPLTEVCVDSDYDALAFKFAALRDMPLVLGPVRTQTASDLIDRARSLPDGSKVAETVAFIKSVTDIQDLANAGRWDDLGQAVDRAHDDVFAYYDATDFLSDARTLACLFRTDLPRLYNDLMFSPVSKSAALTNAVAAFRGRLKENVFCGSDKVRVFIDDIDVRQETAREVARRVGRISSSVPLSADELLELRILLARVKADFDEPAYRTMVADLRKRLAEYATREVNAALGAYEADKKASDRTFVRVAPLCDLCEDAGVDSVVVAKWRDKSREIGRLLDKRYRELYQRYRLGGAMDRETALQIIEEMLTVGGPEGKFRKWALREKARLNKEGEVTK